MTEQQRAVLATGLAWVKACDECPPCAEDFPPEERKMAQWAEREGLRRCRKAQADHWTALRNLAVAAAREAAEREERRLQIEDQALWYDDASYAAWQAQP